VQLYGSEYLIFVSFLVWLIGILSLVFVLILLNVSALTVYSDLEQFNAEAKLMKKEANEREDGEEKEECLGQLAKLCQQMLPGFVGRTSQIDEIFNVTRKNMNGCLLIN
jgi:sensor histidine kinase YesM